MGVRGLGTWKWTLPCIVLVIYGVALRWPTLEPQANYMSFAAGRLAYSDVVIFYSPDNLVPYIQRDIEYPVLTGLTLAITNSLPGGHKGYFLANAVILSLALLGCFVYLVRWGPPVRLSRFALAPGLAFYCVLNWDALGLFGLMAAAYYLHRQRFGWAGAWLAFGTSAKLFPLFVLPVFWAYMMQQGGRQSGMRTITAVLKWIFAPAAQLFLTSFLVVMLVLNLPLAILSLPGWSYFLRFQAGRTSNFDSIWQHVPPIPDAAQSLIFALVFLSGLGWLMFRVLRGDRWEIAMLLSILLFLLFTKVYSPQYNLWLLPLLALTACPLWLWLGFVLVDTTYYWAIFYFYYVYAGGEARVDLSTAAVFVGASVWLRELVLVLLFMWGLRQLSARAVSKASPLLPRVLEAMTNQTRELQQLRSAMETLRSELASMQLGSPTHQREDCQGQPEVDEQPPDGHHVTM